MISFADMKELLARSTRWEKQLKDFYDVAEYALRSRESRKTVAELRDGQAERLGILQSIDVARFGRAEFVRFAPDYDDDEMVPLHRISRESTPREVVDQILASARKLRSFYAGVASHLVSRDQKDLFQSLVTFKDNQIAQIERLLD